jgi:RNA 3'-terminal phosphate cyclase-like protein
VTLLQNVDLSDSGRIKRIRGIAATTRVSPQVSNRLVESCRGLLNPFIPDIYINSDVYKGEEAGKSPGFSISLVAESTTGALLYADQVGAAGGTPEDIGQKAARRLLKEVAGGGYVNSGAHYFLLSLMAMTVDHVNKATLSGLSLSDEEYMASIKDFIGVAFKVRQSSASNTCIVSCLGSGYVNFSQRMQ